MTKLAISNIKGDVKMSKSTNSSKKLETAENLSPTALAEIAKIRADEAEGYLDKKTAERYIHVTTALDMGKHVIVSDKIDFGQMINAHHGLNRIGALLFTISENISYKALDEDGSPLKGAHIGSREAYNIVDLLEIATTTLKEIRKALTLICAE